MSATDGPVQTTAPPQTTSRSKWWRKTTFLIVAAVALLGFGYDIAHWEWPTGAAEGREFSGVPAQMRTVPQRFRVATFNIHGGYGSDGQLDLRRTADALRGADFVGMNEVRGPGRPDPRNQAEQLGTLLGLTWLFAPTETTWTGPHFGQGVLSRFPISSWKRVPFRRVEGNGYRNYVECQLPLNAAAPEAQLTILITHLDRRADRVTQLRTIIRKFLDVPPPAILMGDLNSKITEPQLRSLAQEPGVTDCFGQFLDGKLAKKRIDWVFVRGLKCTQSNLAATLASDHPIGWVELDLPNHSEVR